MYLTKRQFVCYTTIRVRGVWMHLSDQGNHDLKGTCHEQVDNQGPSGTRLQTPQEPVLQLAQAQAQADQRHPEVTSPRAQSRQQCCRD